MPNHNYESGRRQEYQVRNKWRELGYMVLRTAGSHGPFDLVAIHPQRDEILLIQVKRVGGPKDAERVIAKFKKDPPLSPMLHKQVIEVYVKKTRERITSWI